MAEWFKATVLKIVNVNRSRVRISLPPYKKMNNFKFEKKINIYLKSNKIKDTSVNGLQIEGNNNINKIIFCVTIKNSIIKICKNKKYNTIICHHGIFWKKDTMNIIGIKKEIIKNILINNINLYCWHIPLDIHYKVGNNITLSKKLNIKKIINISNYNYPLIIGYSRKKDLIRKIKKINNNYIFLKSKNKKIKKIAICTGFGDKFIEKSIIYNNIDTYITGEMSEYKIIISKKYDINLFLLGHHISEIYGIKYLSKIIKNKYNINTKFINL